MNRFMCADCGVYMVWEGCMAFIAELDSDTNDPRRILKCQVQTCPKCLKKIISRFENCIYDSAHLTVRRDKLKFLRRENMVKTLLLFTTYEKIEDFENKPP